MARLYWTICVRSQRRRGGRRGVFGGPDIYIALVGLPPSAEFPRVLRRDVIEKRGGMLERIGEGYSKNRGPKSAYGKALARAKSLAEKLNGE